MNYSIIVYILGNVLKLESAVLTLPIITSIIYKETEGFYYLLVSVFCLIFGFLLTVKKPTNNVFYLKEGCVSTALSWIILSIFGALPFFLTREIPSYINALFETVSGFTTTGSSILTDIELLSKTSLMWRSFTHWIGGMGVLVFILAVVPLSGGSHINLMRAESPGPSVGKLVPKLRHTARILYLIYIGLTLLEVIFLCAGKMPVFDALTITFGTAGTGGFAPLNSSVASYSAYQQWVVSVFMLLFGINFNAYYFIILGQFKRIVSMEEIWCYLGIILTSTLLVFSDVISRVSSIEEGFRHSFFQVSSIITTTGFVTADFNQWSQTSRFVLVALMFIGACAGSTGGGIKVSRIILLFKTMVKELNSYIHPKSIKKIKLGGKTVEHEVLRSVNVYFVTYFLIFSISVFLISFENKDLVTTFTSVAATFNNIGPGLEAVGPTGNFSDFTCFSKLVFIFDMLAGRLELFPLLILFRPSIWKSMFIAKR